MRNFNQKNATVGELAGSGGSATYLEQIVMRKNQVVKDGEFVVFTECDYEIPVRDLTSQYFIAEWFRHMSEKAWVTKDMLRQFAAIVQQINTVGAK